MKMSVSQPDSGAAVLPDFSSMTEEEQIAYAMQMSLAGGGQFHWPEPKGFITFAVFQMRTFLGFFPQNMVRWTLVPPWTLQNLPR